MRTVENYQEVVTKSSALVWATRKKVEQFWPTPDMESSILYAITEISEAIDSYLRGNRPCDVRNNHKDHSIEYELAQAFMMLLTALGKTPDIPLEDIQSALAEVDDYTSSLWFPSRKDSTLFGLLGMAASITVMLPNYWTKYRYWIYPHIGLSIVSLLALCDWIAIDLVAALDIELNRIEAKWLTP